MSRWVTPWSWAAARASARRDPKSTISEVVSGWPFHAVVEALAIYVLHRDEVDAVGLADVVDVGDARVVEGRCGTGFVFEAPTAVLALGPCRRQGLESDCPAETRVARQPHLTHAPFTELAGDLEMRDLLADHHNPPEPLPSDPR